MSSEEIVLEIEGTSVKCKKELLISNSDYFKAMFEGNFIEKNSNSVKIQDVDLRSMNIILTLLWDPSYYIEEEDVLLVLQTSCMLQFNKIRDMCLYKVIELLSVNNCLKIWLITEQLDLKPLYLKAKSMALSEFMTIKETDIILELTLEQLCSYLGNVYLRTDNELSVFQTLMKWWYENSDNSIKDLLKLLSCIDFKTMASDHLKEILTYPGVASTSVAEILQCLYNIINKITSQKFPKNVIGEAIKFTITTSRISPMCPCILVRKQNEQRKESIVKMDVFKRKTYAKVFPSGTNAGLLTYLDVEANTFEIFFPLKEKLEGFKLIGYKEYVFMYGGEYTLGRGDWNKGLWAYDTIRERWQRKSSLPFPRRHFETCCIGSKLFIIGGTGPYRVHQENLFWYDFKEDEWSKEKSLPVFDRQMKCCIFLDKLFLFSITNCCGYFFENLEHWVTVPIKIDKASLNDKLEFSVFSYKNKFYIKGEKLIELIMSSNQLFVSSMKDVTDMAYIKIESVLCHNLVFTFYLLRSDRNNDFNIICEPFTNFSFEKYNLDTGDKDLILENVDYIQIKEKYEISPPLHMFSFLHFSILENNDKVNKLF